MEGAEVRMASPSPGARDPPQRECACGPWVGDAKRKRRRKKKSALGRERESEMERKQKE